MSVTVSQHKNFVGGEWVDAIEGGTMEVLNPATGETIAEVPQGTQADVDRAVEAAKKALPEWLETTPAERAFQASIDELYGLGYDYDKSYPERIGKVQVDDVVAVVKKFFEHGIVATSSPEK